MDSIPVGICRSVCPRWHCSATLENTLLKSKLFLQSAEKNFRRAKYWFKFTHKDNNGILFLMSLVLRHFHCSWYVNYANLPSSHSFFKDSLVKSSCASCSKQLLWFEVVSLHLHSPGCGIELFLFILCYSSLAICLTLWSRLTPVQSAACSWQSKVGDELPSLRMLTPAHLKQLEGKWADAQLC